jgi:GNAT superfamily N-acetyltransferase
MRIERVTSNSPDVVIEQVVSIHMDQLKVGFLPLLGKGVLRRIYRHAAKHAHFFVCMDGIVVAAFAMGSTNPSAFYKGFALRYFAPVSFAIATRPSVIFRAISGTKYAAQSSSGPELMAIAVNPDYARRGFSRELFQRFARAMRQEGARSFHIVMADTQKAAIEFYKKQNCQFGVEQNIGGLRCFNLTASTS